MADVFISYSKAYRELALSMSALLESHGWSTWWDASLEPADKFRDKIMRELEAARAVISIWTHNSVTSDWVRGEAGRARQRDKLIPLRAKGLGYSDIPLPFGEMHTEDLGNEEAVVRAVKALLARPAMNPSMWRVGWARVRYEALAWFGIVGTSLTLVSNLRGLLTLADWAKVIVQNWVWALHWFWTHALFFVPRLTPMEAIYVTAIVFATVNVVASMQTLEAPSTATSAHRALAIVGALAISLVFVQGFFVAQSPNSEENSRIIYLAVGNPLGGEIFLILNRIYDAMFQWGYWRLNYWFNPYFTTGYAILFVPPIPVSAVVCFALMLSFGWRLSSTLLARRLVRIIVGIVLVLGLNYASLHAERVLSPTPIKVLSR